MTAEARHQMAEGDGSMQILGSKYRVLGNILVFAGYFICLGYLLLLYLLAFSLGPDILAFWESVALPSWPWLVTAFALIGAGCTIMGIDASLQRRRKMRLAKEPKTTRQEPAPVHVQPLVEQHVEA